MQSYPIWNKVENCSYKSDKSYGNKETGRVEVLVGSSSKNSHKLIEHIVTKRYKKEFELDGKKYEDVFVFTFGVEFKNGSTLCLARKIFKNNNNRSGELILEWELGV